MITPICPWLFLRMYTTVFNINILKFMNPEFVYCVRGQMTIPATCYRNRSGKDHIMNLAKMSESRNSICAARPMKEFKFLPWAEASKFTSHRMNTRCSEGLARIWSKQAFSISRNILPFFEVSCEAAWHDSILAEW
jgi:hypothetical protein